MHEFIHKTWARIQAVVATRGPGAYQHAVKYARAATLVVIALGAAEIQVVAASARWLRNARQLRLFVLELAGIILVAYGVSYWSVPAAVILGGLVLVAAVEVRPHVVPSLPQLPVPEPLLRAQAEQAARILNDVQYGIPEVDVLALGKLSRTDCERLITLARSIGTKT